jgi:hypothetical protein
MNVCCSRDVSSSQPFTLKLAARPRTGPFPAPKGVRSRTPGHEKSSGVGGRRRVD